MVRTKRNNEDSFLGLQISYKCVGGQGSAPDPTGGQGELTAPQTDTLTGCWEGMDETKRKEKVREGEVRGLEMERDWDGKRDMKVKCEGRGRREEVREGEKGG